MGGVGGADGLLWCGMWWVLGSSGGTEVGTSNGTRLILMPELSPGEGRQLGCYWWDLEEVKRPEPGKEPEG